MVNELSEMKDTLSSLRKAKKSFLSVAGITNGVVWGGFGSLGAVATMHHVAGHIEMAARYFGASEAVLPYALSASIAGIAGYTALSVTEKIQASRLESKQLALEWKERMSIKRDNAQLVTEIDKSKDKSNIKEVVQEKERPEEHYRVFSSVLKPKGKEKERVRDKEMTMS